jgi:hypothetical protein
MQLGEKDLNAKAQGREDAKGILPLAVRPTKTVRVSHGAQFAFYHCDRVFALIPTAWGNTPTREVTVCGLDRLTLPWTPSDSPFSGEGQRRAMGALSGAAWRFEPRLAIMFGL